MVLGSIGAIQGVSYGALAGLGAASQFSATAPGGLASSLGSSNSMGQLIDAVNASNLPASTKVAISDAAQTLLSGDNSQTQSSFGELAQALIIALILQMLAPGN